MVEGIVKRPYCAVMMKKVSIPKKLVIWFAYLSPIVCSLHLEKPNPVQDMEIRTADCTRWQRIMLPTKKLLEVQPYK